MTREQVNTQVQNLLIPLVEVSNHLESNQVMLNYLDQEIARLAQDIDGIILFNPSDYYTKTQTNTFLSGKANLVGGKIPENELPSYVDDVLEFDSFEDFPTVGEGSKIYIDKEENKTYRWGGSIYVAIGSGAPVSGSPNYIQNQSASAQSASFWIDGNGKMTSGNLTVDTINSTVGVVVNSTNNAYSSASYQLNGTQALQIGAAGSSAENLTNTNYILSNSRDLVFTNNLTESMRIKSNGYVGIGTNSPGSMLDVGGGVRVLNRTFPTSGTGIEFGYNLSGQFGEIYTYDRTNSAYKPMGFGVASKQVYLKPDSKVGINTDAPTAGLHNVGTTFLNGGVDIGDNAYYDGTVALSIKSNRNWLFNMYNQYTQLVMGLHQNGNLRIGDANLSTAPSKKITIDVSNATDFDGINIASTGSNYGPRYWATNGNGVAGVFGVYNSGFTTEGFNDKAHFGSTHSIIIFSDAGVASGGSNNVTFRVGGYGADQERMRITASGNVGIGTTNPTEKLDVDGKVKTNSVVLKSGTESVQILAATGSTNHDFILPATVGANADYLASDGAGGTRWVASPALSSHYTPTLTDIDNVTESTPYDCYYVRTGNVVTVHGSLSLTPITTDGAEVNISLPVAPTSAFTDESQLTGTASSFNLFGSVVADTVNTKARLKVITSTISAETKYNFSFSYRISELW